MREYVLESGQLKDKVPKRREIKYCLSLMTESSFQATAWEEESKRAQWSPWAEEKENEIWEGQGDKNFQGKILERKELQRKNEGFRDFQRGALWLSFDL